jgi:hypothetical protein
VDYQARGIEHLSEMIEDISLRMLAMEEKMEALRMAQMTAHMATKGDLEQLGKVVSDSLRAFRSSSSDKHR